MKVSDFRPAVPSELHLGDIEFLTDAYEQLAEHMITLSMPSAHRTAALRLLLESKMTLIHGITHPDEKP